MRMCDSDQTVIKMTIAVIGLGSMGKRRIRLMKAMRLPVELIGVDSVAERCSGVKEQFGIDCFSSLEEAERNNKIDCAFLCTSPLAHADLIRLCLIHGYHVFTEINLVSDRYSENITLAHEKGLTLFLSSTPIYRDEMRKIMELLSDNGKNVNYIYHVGQYLPDWHPWEKFKDFFVGDSRTNGCREIFAIELPWMTKAFGDIKNVSVVSSRLTSLEIDYRDSYLVQINHENGNSGLMAVDVVCRKPVRKLEVYNEDLYIEWEGTPRSLKTMNLISGEMEVIPAGEYHNEPGYSEFVNECAYINEIKEFFDILEGKTPQYTMADDEKILKIIDTIENA